MERFQNTGQPDWDWWGRLWPAPGETLRALGVEEGITLAEIGCGNGYFALPAARITAPGPVYALDLDQTLLGELDHLADQQDIDNVVPIHCDARQLESHLPDPVDVAMIANTFHGISDPEAFVREVSDTLADDGTFVVVNWYDRPRQHTTVQGEPSGPPTDLRLSPAKTEQTVLEAADFEHARQVELPPYHYALLFER
jgi:SAM-dependent methyltransferase